MAADRVDAELEFLATIRETRSFFRACTRDGAAGPTDAKTLRDHGNHPRVPARIDGSRSSDPAEIDVPIPWNWDTPGWVKPR